MAPLLSLFLSLFLLGWIDTLQALAPQPTPPVNRRACLAGLCLGVPFLATTTAPALAAPPKEEPVVYGRCLDSCVKECTTLAPGEANKAYCQKSCEDYCRTRADEGVPSDK